ncbi:Maf family protein [Candidatus Rhodoluna planktonica]|uniref:Nucleoside triphosphate pyrophosphatase n=1 Tax=Candidatus Rhodoluna planktonica TaxID=535712 RepID=A0A1D9E009_9MICO|nr:nucleoside triphosphate pyrophosphatase [Candidatus Rhodoluna planktonica]AOY56398.1 septum formation inhibitor Maf [Candidatus Rhodoluna planktonica]
MTKLILASTSPARLTLLRNAGIEPVTMAPEVDEDAVVAELVAAGKITNTEEMVMALARAKAEAVASRPESAGALVLGCDSSLELDGQWLGKPHTAEVATARWQQMRGRSGTLFSGHWLIDNRTGLALPNSNGAVGKASGTVVNFANLSDAEIAAYVATGEPLKVAGAFTIDGLGGAFLNGIEGDAHTVIGLSLPVLRQLTGELAVDYTSLWNR